MDVRPIDTGLVATLLALAIALGGTGSAQAFWPRGQVSMCADATSARERARHRCDELNGYADPGWPALGLGDAGHGAYRGKASGKNRGPAPGYDPANRPPVRRLG
jgi:hypothetical protein